MTLHERQPAGIVLAAPESHSVLEPFALSLLTARLGKKLNAYLVTIKITPDPHVRRDNLLLRVTEGGRTRALQTMSFNYYHRDSVAAVKRKLDKRLAAFVKKLEPKLLSEEQVIERRARQLRAELKKQERLQREQGRLPETVAWTGRSLEALEKALETK